MTLCKFVQIKDFTAPVKEYRTETLFVLQKRY